MRGHYRILLGMAAGVGKTYRMLQEGRQAATEGRDVVIGYLEPHDRPETAALAEGLELVPRVAVPHAGLVLGEMDVDAVLRRAPELALVDELAHTNAPGSRNEKRYEDIDEILEAGIDVISTVNVQHLESLNDTIFEITDVRVRETFPDRVLDEADEVVLVDLAPEALQQRLEAGKIYPQARAEVALINFFRLENLSSLRELALREVAEDVEARQATERAGAAEPAGGGGARAGVDRAAAQVAAHPPASVALGADGSAPTSTRSGCGRPGGRRPDEEAIQLAALRRLASVLGVHFLEEEGDDLVATVRRVAHERGSTYVFVGTPDERRRVEILRGSLLSRMVASFPGSTSGSSPIAPTGEHSRHDDCGLLVVVAVVFLVAVIGNSTAARGVILRSTGAAAARRLHRRGSGPDRPLRCDPHRPCRERDARAGIPARRPSQPRRGRAGDGGGRRRNALARGGRARGAEGGGAGRRPDREGPDADPRPQPAVGRRAVRPRHRSGPDRERDAGFTPRTSPGS